MRQLPEKFLVEAQKLVSKDKVETLQYTRTDLMNYRENFKTCSELGKSQIKAGFAQHGLNVETVTDLEIETLAKKLTDLKWTQIIEKFQDYELDKILRMAESNHNKLSHLFLEIYFELKLPKTARDRLPILNDLRNKNYVKIDSKQNT